jgi:hypothetical protein
MTDKDRILVPVFLARWLVEECRQFAAGNGMFVREVIESAIVDFLKLGDKK